VNLESPANEADGLFNRERRQQFPFFFKSRSLTRPPRAGVILVGIAKSFFANRIKRRFHAISSSA